MAIELTDEMRKAIGGALSDGVPVIVAYADADGQPHISFRGTTQVFGSDRLAFWARDPEGGVLRAIETNPRLTLLYRNPQTRQGWQFFGRARVTGDPAQRDAIYESSPQVERDRDPERRGRAVIVDVDRVVERGQVIMERD